MGQTLFDGSSIKFTLFSRCDAELADMSTEAPQQTLAPAPGRTHEQETAPLPAPESLPAANAFRSLDHRCRSRAVLPGMARRGPYLAVEDGGQTRLIALEARITHIGRSMQANVRIENQSVSRSHAIIVRHGRFARLLDNRSSNGTYLNGRRIVATNLANGDLIGVGSLELRYVEIP